jgi:hypothetical protein
MHQIDLRAFDLNLLVVFEVLMIERSVTRAAERLGRTQSAVSHSLARLRSQLGDPLLTKGGVRMQPTTVALELMEQARPMLRGIERLLAPRHVFDPATSRRVFRVAAPDFTLSLFASLLARAARADAAGFGGGADRRRDRAGAASHARRRQQRSHRRAEMAMLLPERSSGVVQMGPQELVAMAASGGAGWR